MPETILTAPSKGSAQAIEKSLSDAERNIVQYHRKNLKAGTVGKDPEGRPITVYSMGIWIPEGPYKGKFAAVPGFVDGTVVTNERLLWEIWADEINKGKWPIYKSGAELNKRSKEIHTIMDYDVEK